MDGEKESFSFFGLMQGWICDPFLPLYHAGNCPVRQLGYLAGFAGPVLAYPSLSSYLFYLT